MFLLFLCLISNIMASGSSDGADREVVRDPIVAETWNLLQESMASQEVTVDGVAGFNITLFGGMLSVKTHNSLSAVEQCLLENHLTSDTKGEFEAVFGPRRPIFSEDSLEDLRTQMMEAQIYPDTDSEKTQVVEYTCRILCKIIKRGEKNQDIVINWTASNFNELEESYKAMIAQPVAFGDAARYIFGLSKFTAVLCYPPSRAVLSCSSSDSMGGQSSHSSCSIS